MGASVMGPYIMFRVRRTDWQTSNPRHQQLAVLVNARNRDFAKSHASHLLAGNPDNYEVEPITDLNEDVIILANVIH